MSHKPQRPVLRVGHPLARDIMGAWPLQNGLGIVASDFGPHLADGNLAEGAVWTEDSPFGGFSVLFDGLDARIEDFSSSTKDRISVTGKGESTVISWVKGAIDATVDGIYVETNSVDGTVFRFDVGVADRLCMIVKESGGQNRSIDTTGFLDNTWHHIACSLNSQKTRMRLYIDGVLKIDNTVLWDGTFRSFAITGIAIGAFVGTTGEFAWKGPMNYMATYERELDPLEVEAQFLDTWQIWREDVIALEAVAVLPDQVIGANRFPSPPKPPNEDLGRNRRYPDIPFVPLPGINPTIKRDRSDEGLPGPTKTIGY